jgi:ferric-dicitrate binding protein FerR (iron transport regulator)
MTARQQRSKPRGRPDRRRRPRTGWLLGGVLVVAALVAGVVWLAGQGSTGTGSTATGSTATGSRPLAVQPAPSSTLALPSTTGPAVTLQSLHGKRVVLYFYEGST